VNLPLARILDQEQFSRPRGPDAFLRVTVPEAWIQRPCVLEITLPRVLACANCQGGGCDACSRQGGVPTRARKAEAERIVVQIPAFSGQGITIRLPEKGGLPDRKQTELPRGILMLALVIGDPVSECISLLEEVFEPVPASEQRPMSRKPEALVVDDQRNYLLLLIFIVLLVFFAALRVGAP
jgi:hypothetical protein